jgi:hypothetical protein
MELSNNLRLIAHAMLGGIIGFFSSCIFLMLYYFTQYSEHISESLRFKNAFWSTVWILIVCIGVYLLVQYKLSHPTVEDDEDDDDEE